MKILLIFITFSMSIPLMAGQSIKPDMDFVQRISKNEPSMPGDIEGVQSDKVFMVTLPKDVKKAFFIKINNQKGIPYYSVTKNHIRQKKAKFYLDKSESGEGYWFTENSEYEANRNYSFWDLEKNGSLYLAVHHTHSPVSGILSLWRVNRKTGVLVKIYEVYGEDIAVYEEKGKILLEAWDSFFISRAIFDSKSRRVSPLYAVGFQMEGSGHLRGAANWPEKISLDALKEMKTLKNNVKVYTNFHGEGTISVRLKNKEGVFRLYQQKKRSFVLYAKAYKGPFLKQFKKRVYSYGWIDNLDMR